MDVLVTYASKRGGTEGIATAIGEALATLGIHAEVTSADRASMGHGYDAVIIGSALYMFRCRTAARVFVRRNADALQKVPVWFFSSGPLDDSATQREIPPVKSMARLMERVHARGHQTFGGRMLSSATGFPASAMAKTRSGDWRDWEQIRAWAATIARELGSTNSSAPAAEAPVTVGVR